MRMWSGPNRPLATTNAAGPSGNPTNFLGGFARIERLSRRFDGFPTNTLILCDHLRPHQEHQSSDLHAQQHRDRCRERAINHLDLRHGGVVPNQKVAVISQSNVAVTPPMSAWRSDGRPTGKTK